MTVAVCADAKAPEDNRSDATLADRERQAIYEILEETGGNKSETARRLGITRRTLKLKLKKYAEENASSQLLAGEGKDRHGSR